MASAMLSLRCASADRLSSVDLAKLDIRLRPLLLGAGGAGDGCVSSIRSDGIRIYTVLIRGSADELHTRGIPVIGAVGDVLTAALTIEQLREAARIPSVRSLDCGSWNTIEAPPSSR